MNRTKLAGISFILLSLGFTYSSSAREGKKIDLRGKITRIQRASDKVEGRFVGSVLVEGDKKANANLDKANLIVTGKTLILKNRGKKRLPARFEDLKVGGIVEVRFVEGPTILIYPLRVGAAEIVILNKSDAKE